MYILSHESHYFKVIYKLLNNAKKETISIVCYTTKHFGSTNGLDSRIHKLLCLDNLLFV